MNNEDKISLCKYRLAKAEELLDNAKVILSMGIYDAAANRSYYAIFHSVRALFALEGKDFKKHSGIISNFNKDYVKTHIFDKDMSNIILKAFDIRQESDYKDFYVISHEEVQHQVENAEFFLNNVKFYIDSLLNEN